MRDKSDRFNYERLNDTGWVPVAFTDIAEGDVFRVLEQSDGRDASKLSDEAKAAIAAGEPTTRAGEVPIGHHNAYVCTIRPHRTKRIAVTKWNPNTKQNQVEFKGVMCEADDPDVDPRSMLSLETRRATLEDLARARIRDDAARTQEAADRAELARLQAKLS